jgi:beta-xylosidase
MEEFDIDASSTTGTAELRNYVSTLIRMYRSTGTELEKYLFDVNTYKKENSDLTEATLRAANIGTAADDHNTLLTKHWENHGIVLSTATFKWAKQGDNAWASQAIERNGKWYWYVSAEDTVAHLHGIGVAVADRPEGPWTDPIGRPLIPGNWGYIDPTVFIDDDGQAYLFWGNNGCWYAKLNEEMVSIDTSFGDNGIRDMRPMLDDEAQFGPRRMKHDYQVGKKVMKTNFEEAPWIYKIGDTYYLEYAAGGVPEHWAYSTAKSIHGPWTYRGRITDESPGSFTIHGGTIDFRGKSYLFYHDGIPSGGNGFRRSTVIREFQRGKDGSIPKINIKE